LGAFLTKSFSSQTRWVLRALTAEVTAAPREVNSEVSSLWE
jgi:hypothetical protein